METGVCHEIAANRRGNSGDIADMLHHRRQRNRRNSNDGAHVKLHDVFLVDRNCEHTLRCLQRAEIDHADE